MLRQAEYPALIQLFSDKPVPSGSFLQPLRREICAHDAVAYRTADFAAGVQHRLWAALHAAPAARIRPFCSWNLPATACLGACSPDRACVGTLVTASCASMEEAGKRSRVPPWTFCDLLYYYARIFLYGDDADRLSICTGSIAESAVLISFSLAGGCYDISILSAAIAAEGAGNILG